VEGPKTWAILHLICFYGPMLDFASLWVVPAEFRPPSWPKI
jgi:hypothetical protein